MSKLARAWKDIAKQERRRRIKAEAANVVRCHVDDAGFCSWSVSNLQVKHTPEGCEVVIKSPTLTLDFDIGTLGRARETQKSS